MASDFGMRGQAAQRLAKGKKGAPPPEEDDLGLPPEDGAGMPPADGGGGAPDLAALLGAGGGGEGAMPPPEEGAPMPEEGMPPEEGGGAQDLDSALGGVENALEGLPPEAAEEIRVHLNAIREIASKQAGGAPVPEMQGPSGGNDMGMEMPPAPVADQEVSG